MIGKPLTNDEIMDKYRGVYPFLKEESLGELRECNRRFLFIAFRQIERLKREGKWLTNTQGETRNSADRQI